MKHEENFHCVDDSKMLVPQVLSVVGYSQIMLLQHKKFTHLLSLWCIENKTLLNFLFDL